MRFCSNCKKSVINKHWRRWHRKGIHIDHKDDTPERISPEWMNIFKPFVNIFSSDKEDEPKEILSTSFSVGKKLD